MRITTKKGDDGTTGLLFGGRVRKDAALPEAYGQVDEAQAALGVARAEATGRAVPPNYAELDEVLVHLERDLWVLMAELATEPANRAKLTPGASLVTSGMVEALEARMEELEARFPMPTEFVVPGQNRLSALLDLARTVVRRAERAALGVAAEGSFVVPYLNRLSDLVWTMARAEEGSSLLAREDA